MRKGLAVPVLAQRLLFPLLLLGVVTSLGVAVAFRFVLQRETDSRVIERARFVSDAVHTAGQATTTLGAFERLLFGFASSEEVREIVVLSGTPLRVVAASRRSLLGESVRSQELVQFSEVLAPVLSRSVQVSQWRSGSLFYSVEEVGLPLAEGEGLIRGRGYAIVVIDARELDARFSQLSLLLIAAGALSSVIWGGVAFLLLRRYVLRPLAQLDGIIGSGQRSVGIEKTKADELSVFRDNLIEALYNREVAERELVAARDAAEAGARAKADFLATMSHEIRTPMNGVLGFVSVLLESPLSSEQREIVQTIHASGESLLVVINDILDFSKLESGKFTIEETPFELEPVVLQAIALMRGRASEKGLDLRVDYDLSIPRRVTGDPTRLRQVILNLLSNAVKFTDRGSITLTVARNPNLGPDSVSVAVTDTGIGLTSEQRSRLFQKFVQADSTTTRKYGGTGLGLAISRRLVELMGGSLGVLSEPGEGSTFSFSLPLPRARGVLYRDVPVSNVPMEVSLDGLRVLVAEDTKTNQALVERILLKLGCRVSIAENGEEALSRVRQEEFDVVLMDCHMPVMDGYEATKSLRAFEIAHPLRRRLPVIAVTANALTGDREACIEAGMDDYITKPIRKDELRDCLVRAMTGPSPGPRA